MSVNFLSLLVGVRVLVGATDGLREGVLDGPLEGVLVGATDGLREGVLDGPLDGVLVGTTDGL